MGLFKKFSAPKAKIELKLDEVAYDYKDKLTGKIVIDPQEEISINEFRLEFSGSRKVKWKKGFSSYSSSSPLETQKITVGAPVKLSSGQHYEQPFQIEIPIYQKPDQFTELEVKVKGVAVIQGRPDLTHEVAPVINFPYVVECIRQYGGCGFITQPLPEPPKTCPRCGNNLEEVWNRKYADELRESQERSRGMRRS